MVLFIIGLVILIGGGALYGRYCEKVFGPDDRPTPAIAMADGVDYVGMKSWKNQLIELLNIAGTGPVLGPIQGILFGPIAFLIIPIGCVIAGSMHDYFSAMMSMRAGGAQMPKLMGDYIGKGTKGLYSTIIWVLMLLVGAVFVYTPGDLIAHDLLGVATTGTPIIIIYACIFLYYIIATIFPIDVIIGRIYPIFGFILLIAAVGIFIGVLFTGSHALHPITEGALVSVHPKGQRLIPVFFITVACGIMSGFHSTQATMISRTVTSEYEGRKTFYNMMLCEGFIAMCWAAGAMVVYNEAGKTSIGATLMVGEVARRFMGNIGGMIAVAGVIVLPITSGDTAFRSLRLMVSEQFNIDQKTMGKRVRLSACLFIPAILILWWAKTNANGFNILWQYFGFANQLVAVFALCLITIFLKAHDKPWLIAGIPGFFYTFDIMSFIFHNDKLGFRVDKLLGNPKSYTFSYILGLACACFFIWFSLKKAKENKDFILNNEAKFKKISDEARAAAKA